MINKLFLLSAFLLLAFFAEAQKSIDWGAFGQTISAKLYAGKKFKLEAAVKVKLIDSTASAQVWFRVDKSNKTMGFFYNMMDKPIRVKNWEVFTIEGTIDTDAEFLVFGGIYHKKGIFYFDNFNLSVEMSKDKFEEIKIANGGFEEDSLKANWRPFQNQAGFEIMNNKEEFFEGKQSCKVDGSSLKKIYSYGNNDSVGKFITANGINIYYEEYGQGQPLLLLHGNSESIGSFKLQIPELSKYYKVIAVDTRGQGKSSEDGKVYSYDYLPLT